MVQVPNIVLNTLWIENVTRSNAMKEQLDMFIAFDTTLQDIDTLRTEMEAFVHHPDNSRDFQPDVILETTGLGKMDALQLKVEIRHKSNWHNETVRAARRSKFMCALVLAMRKVPIYGPGGGAAPLGDFKNPSYSVAVSDELAITAREKAKDDMEAKRLIPSAPAPSTSDSKSTAVESPSELKAAEQLNSRKPTDFLGNGWTSRDDMTLGEEREESFDLQRNEDIDTLRSDLLKRESTRGRRKPGEAIPPLPTNIPNNPSMTVTGASPRHNNNSNNGFRSHISDALDEEMQVGIHHSHPHHGQNTARDIRTEVMNPGTGPQAGQGQMVQPRYVFPPTTPEGGVGERDYLSAGAGVPPVPSQGCGVGNGRIPSTEGQSRLRGLSLAQSAQSGASLSSRSAGGYGSQSQSQRQGRQ